MAGVAPGKMDRDPFRFLGVSDAEAPPEQVRGDKMTVRKRSASTLEQREIEIHAERPVSEADGGGV